jgi:hypothetical protein
MDKTMSKYRLKQFSHTCYFIEERIWWFFWASLDEPIFAESPEGAIQKLKELIKAWEKLDAVRGRVYEL